MNFLFDLLAPILGFITLGCYFVVQNVGLSIIIFTLIVKILMFPLSARQHRNTAKSNIFSPRLKEIQTKYRNDNQKFQEEFAKLKKDGYNPTGGCIPMVATMLILFGVLGVVYKPMTYFEKINKEDIQSIKSIAQDVELGEYDAKMAIEFEKERDNYTVPENENGEELTEKEIKEKTEEYNKNLKARYESNRDKFVTALETNYSNKNLRSELLAIGIYKNNQEKFAKISPDSLEKLEKLEKNIVFLGIDFSQQPNIIFAEGNSFFSLILLVPVLCFIFAAGQTVVQQMVQRKTSPESVQQMGAMKYMIYFMPFMSLYFSFTFPAGAGFYWAVSSAVGMAQTLLLNRMYPPEKLREEAMESLKNKGYELENIIVIEKHDGRTIEKRESEMSSNEKKEHYRKKLDEARKADLEKYGEIPNEKTDKE